LDRNLVIFLDGGGACFNSLTCLANANSVGNQAPGKDGIFQERDDNPVTGWNFVHVPYCTGDIFAGTQSNVQVPGVSGKQNFVGFRNMQRIMDQLQALMPDLETVLVTGVSAGGFGAVAETHGGWGRTGMLIGFRRVDSLDWQIALIRRLSRSVEGRLSIGAQGIAGATACARVRFGSGDAGNPWVAVAGTTDAYHDAILLRGEQGTRLLLTPGVFGGAQECMLSFERVWHQARLERTLEQGYDFDLVEVRVAPANADA